MWKGVSAMYGKGKSPQGLAAEGGGVGNADSRSQTDCSRARETSRLVAYRVHKPGRGDGWPIVGKVTRFEDGTRPILAVVWRWQQGTCSAISMPRAVLLDAQRRGARDFFLRDDNAFQMWHLPITEFLRGRLRGDGEHYVLISHMQPCEWRAWAYVERAIKLDDEPKSQPVAVQQRLL